MTRFFLSIQNIISPLKIPIYRDDYIIPDIKIQSGAVSSEINAKHCISPIPQELHIIKPTETHTYGVMRYNNGIAVIDDIHANA